MNEAVRDGDPAARPRVREVEALGALARVHGRSMISVRHHAASSCSVIRRVLSPWTRSRRSMAAGQNPLPYA